MIKQIMRQFESIGRNARAIILTLVGVALIVGVTIGITLLFSFRAQDRTQVPNLIEQDLTEALLQLQNRDLQSHIQLRYHADGALEGKVIAQSPLPGAIVRIGRRVNLTVSLGAVLDAVADWRGRPLFEVRDEINALPSDQAGLIKIDTISYVFSESPSGIVLQQDPAPGTPISGSINMDLVVSRGSDRRIVVAPVLEEVEFREAIGILEEFDLSYEFKINPRSNDMAGLITEQTPKSGREIDTYTLMRLTMQPPEEIPDGFLFGYLVHEIPRSNNRVSIKIEIEAEDGTRRQILETRHFGGELTIPYIVPEGSTLYIVRADQDIAAIPAEPYAP